jgi:hypothetical protein
VLLVVWKLKMIFRRAVAQVEEPVANAKPSTETALTCSVCLQAIPNVKPTSCCQVLCCDTCMTAGIARSKNTCPFCGISKVPFAASASLPVEPKPWPFEEPVVARPVPFAGAHPVAAPGRLGSGN